MNYLAMAARDEAHGAQDFQHGHLHFGIVGRQTLRDDFDRRRVRQHVRPSRLQKLSEKKHEKKSRLLFSYSLRDSLSKGFQQQSPDFPHTFRFDHVFLMKYRKFHFIFLESHRSLRFP